MSAQLIIGNEGSSKLQTEGSEPLVYAAIYYICCLVIRKTSAMFSLEKALLVTSRNASAGSDNKETIQFL